jgi:hypothetical protein
MTTDFSSLSPNGKTRTNTDSSNEYPDKTSEEALQRATLILSAQDAKVDASRSQNLDSSAAARGECILDG